MISYDTILLRRIGMRMNDVRCGSMVSVHDLWNLVIEELKKEVPYIALQTWFDDIEVIELRERTLSLYRR